MNDNNQNTEAVSEEPSLSEVLQIRRDKLKALVEAGKNPFEKVKYDFDTYTDQIRDNFDEMEGKTVRIAGRLMSRRDMGKANFIDIADAHGRIQCYVRINDIGEETFDEYRKWDIGDIIGLSGYGFPHAPRRNFRTCI